MVEDRLVIAFLVVAGPASPKDVGVCVLKEKDGRRAWLVLDKLCQTGYVEKLRHATYAGVRGVAVSQREMW